MFANPLQSSAIRCNHAFVSFRILVNKSLADCHHEIRFDESFARRNRFGAFCVCLNNEASSDQPRVSRTGEHRRHGLSRIHADEVHVLDGHAFLLERCHKELMEHRALRSHDLLAFELLDGIVRAGFADDGKDLLRVPHTGSNTDGVAGTGSHQHASRIHDRGEV